MSVHYCPRCNFRLIVPDDLTPMTRSAVAQQVRIGQKLEAIASLRVHQPDLRQAKAITNHLTQTGGSCVRCAHVFSEPGESLCPRCGALNFNW